MARLDDTSDPTAQNWQLPTGISSPDISGLNSSGNAQGIDYGGGWTPAAGLHSSANSPYIDYGGSWSQNPVSALPVSDTTPIGGGGAAQGATVGAGGNGSPNGNGGPGNGGMAQRASMAGGGGNAAVHNAMFYKDNGQAAVDGTYVAQRQALLQKLNDYEGNVAKQVGDANLQRNDSNDPKDLLGYSYGGKSLSPDGIFNNDVDVNGDSHFSAKDIAHGGLGGTLGADYATGVANFDNQQSHGLRNVAEDFAARGMLGSGSGVWQTARNNLQDQYKQQLGNMNNSAVGQYNNLLGNLSDQFSQGRSALTGYLTDASNRMATQDAMNLPKSL